MERVFEAKLISLRASTYQQLLMIVMCWLVAPLVQSVAVVEVHLNLLMNRIVQSVTDSDLPVRKNWHLLHPLLNRCPAIN